jgi:hypothetical protein
MNNKIVAFKSVLLLAVVSAMDSNNNIIQNPELGPQVWTSSNPEVAEIRHGSGGEVFLVGTDVTGTTTVTVSGDSDPSTPLSYNGAITVTFLPDEVTVVELDATPVTPEAFTLATAPTAE